MQTIFGFMLGKNLSTSCNNYINFDGKFASLIASGSYKLNSSLINGACKNILNEFDYENIKFVVLDKNNFNDYSYLKNNLLTDVICNEQDCVNVLNYLVNLAESYTSFCKLSKNTNYDHGKIVIVAPEIMDFVCSNNDSIVISLLVKLSKLCKIGNIYLIAGTANKNLCLYDYYFRNIFTSVAVFKHPSNALVDYLSYGKFKQTNLLKNNEYYYLSFDYKNGSICAI